MIAAWVKWSWTNIAVMLNHIHEFKLLKKKKNSNIFGIGLFEVKTWNTLRISHILEMKQT